MIRAILVLSIGVALLAACGGGSNDGPAPTPTLAKMRGLDTAPPRSLPTRIPLHELSLLSLSCARTAGGSYIEVEGFVKNITSKPIDSIQAVAIIRDADGTPFTSDTALIEYRPLLPGQESPYNVLVTFNPAFARCNIEFKRFIGGTIGFRDDRP